MEKYTNTSSSLTRMNQPGNQGLDSNILNMKWKIYISKTAILNLSIKKWISEVIDVRWLFHYA